MVTELAEVRTGFQTQFFGNRPLGNIARKIKQVIKDSLS